MASAMIQEMFAGHITPVAAAGFVGLMCLFNIGGRFFWASTVGLYRPQEHLLHFFILGIVCCLLMPWSANAGSTSWSVRVCRL